jgi:hypothetical protein
MPREDEVTTARAQPRAERVLDDARRLTRHHAAGATASPDPPAAVREGADDVVLVPDRRRDLARVLDGTR